MTYGRRFVSQDSIELPNLVFRLLLRSYVTPNPMNAFSDDKLAVWANGDLHGRNGPDREYNGTTNISGRCKNAAGGGPI